MKDADKLLLQIYSVKNNTYNKLINLLPQLDDKEKIVNIMTSILKSEIDLNKEISKPVGLEPLSSTYLIQAMSSNIRDIINICDNVVDSVSKQNNNVSNNISK